MPPPIALTIAGFDPSNGAGITADLQTFAAHGLFGTSAITALTVQSTWRVDYVEPVSEKLFLKTLYELRADLPPAGIKIGMLATSEIVSQTALFIQVVLSKTFDKSKIPIVLDPVILSSSGTPLLDAKGVRYLHDKLLDGVSWITPNWAELAVLASRKVQFAPDAEVALHVLGERYPHLHIVATGGDHGDQPIDLLRTPDGEIHQFPGKRIDTTSTHGTGCAFSSALLSRLMLGDAPVAAVAAAKAFVEGALRHAPGVGHGRGPMDLLWPLRHPPLSSEP